MHPIRITATVLIGLDLDQGRLGRSGQARNRPRVRVGLLELVCGAVYDEFAKFVERGSSFDVGRERWGIVGLDELEQKSPNIMTRLFRGSDLRDESFQHHSLEHGAKLEQPRAPLPI